MEFFRIKRDIPFMRHALVFNVISFVTFALAVFFLVTRGLHFSIEFTGGNVIEVEYAVVEGFFGGMSIEAAGIYVRPLTEEEQSAVARRLSSPTQSKDDRAFRP